jgi:hypothetical protein
MIGRIRRLPSPALVISAIALIFAIGGGTFAIASSDNAKDKKIANQQITKRAPGLSVNHANSADSATTATNAGHASSADSATTATNAGHASSTDSATTATNATNASHADSADNANLLDGRAANELNRVGLSSNENLFALASTSTDGSVGITAPAGGFVKVDASLVASDAFAASFCTNCVLVARLHDVGTGGNSPASLAGGGLGSRATYLSMSLHWVFPATQGPHTYSLTSTQSDTGGPLDLYNVVLTAQYIPSGATGSSASLAASVATSPHSAGTDSAQPVWRGR